MNFGSPRYSDQSEIAILINKRMAERIGTPRNERKPWREDPEANDVVLAGFLLGLADDELCKHSGRTWRAVETQRHKLVTREADYVIMTRGVRSSRDRLSFTTADDAIIRQGISDKAVSDQVRGLPKQVATTPRYLALLLARSPDRIVAHMSRRIIGVRKGLFPRRPLSFREAVAAWRREEKIGDSEEWQRWWEQYSRVGQEHNLVRQ